MQRHDEAALNDAAREGEAGDAGEAGQPSESATLTQDEQRLASDPAPRPNILTAPGVDNANRWRPGERLIDLFWQRCDALERDGLAKTRIALEVDGVALTYAGLRDQVRRAGHALNACGLKPGARVGLLLDRALAGYGAMLAAVSAGLVYVPLDTKFPAERIAYIADDAELEAFIAVSDALALAAPTGLPVIDAGDLWAGAPLASVADFADVAEMANAASSASPLRKTLPLAEANHGPPSHQDAEENAATGVGDALAYIIYTSGSTGRPKGVAVNHSAICNFIAVAAEAYGYRDDDRVYQGLTFAFDFSIEEFWVPLAVGATLVASPRDIQLVGPALHAFLTAQRITAMACVPTLLATLKDDVPNLRFLLLSGEACPPDLVRRWARPERRLLNAYGPTEATVTATWTPLAPGRAVTIGVPLATYTIVLLEPDADQLTAPGEEGEIAIAGVGLANGYVKRPELTAQKFIADFLGLADNPSGRLYRTGDWGRITPEGEIAYLGRIDSQVKLKGYRIELGEIEEAMLQLDGVAQACVAVHESADGTKDLVGYYSAFAGVEGGSGVGGAAAAAMQAPQRAWIAQRLRESLPAYMVPTYLEPLPALPLMPSQKVDRTRLPAPALPRVTVQTADHEAPATPTETRVAQVVAQVLGLDDAPSVKAHLFEDLGLDSLRAAEVIMALDEAFGDANVAIERVYRAPTIRGLAAGIDEAGEEAGERVVAPPTPRGSDRAHAVCATLQGLTYIGLFAAYIAASYASLVWIAHAPDLSAWFARSALCALGFLLGPTLLALAAKWVLIGRWRPQRLRLWSLGYVRFWFVRLLVETSPPALFRNSPVFNVYLRALGARVGDHALLAPKSFPLCTDLLTIGNNVVARKGCHITGYHAEGGFLEIGPIVLGDDAVIGENAVIAFNTGMGTGAQLAHASALLPGQSIEAGARAHGSPARPASSSFAHESVHAPSTLRRRVYGACEAGVTFLAAMLTLAAVIALVFSRSDPRTWGEAASAQRIIFNVDAIGTVALYVALAFLIRWPWARSTSRLRVRSTRCSHRGGSIASTAGVSSSPSLSRASATSRSSTR
ncbi:MAG: amino acid adenylation domain-containing protein, partial [Pseudomonadota bacterium]